MLKPIPSLEQRIQNLAEKAGKYGEVRTLGKVPCKERQLSIVSFRLGSEDSKLPTLGLFGGVHGLEQIGTEVIVAFLESFVEQLSWDERLRERLKFQRLVSIPLINPAGMALGQRSNPQGVDLMRNAPIEGVDTPFLVGGHRISPMLPWYRGAVGAKLEVESQALIDFVVSELLPARVGFAVDFHSGFGLQDRLWYPFAKSKERFPYFDNVQKVLEILDQTLPQHVYRVESQSDVYTTHGDLWDFLFEKHLANQRLGTKFIPWTLEMGSWLWVRKNPLQILSARGIFNPIKSHRQKRIMRRHRPLIQLFWDLVGNEAAWGRD